MIIKNPSLLAEYRIAGRCGYCNRHCRVREAAHLLSTGAGGSDLRCNLIALGSTLHWCCTCHSMQHSGHSPTPAELLDKVAEREKVSAETIKDVWYFIARLDKDAPTHRIEEALLVELTGDARRIARRELTESGKLP